MIRNDKPVRVLYSFPHKIGAQRICFVAWHQVDGLVTAGAEVLVCPGSVAKPLAPGVRVHSTLAWGRFRIPYRALGRTGACVLHDWRVARWVRAMREQIDVVHTWPLGAARTLRAARECGILTVLERPNAHTRFAYQVVEEECRRLGITMPSGHEHAYNEVYLRKEEAEYQLADILLCPSEFVARTFIEKGFPKEKLAVHQYGFDEKSCYPSIEPRNPKRGLTVLFAAGCAPRKGLHVALDAWLQSSAHHEGTFLVVGEFIPGYAERISNLLAHPSVKRLGFRKDLPDVMRSADVLVLPSIEEGSALVTYDARGCGCVLLVSDASGAVCRHGENALVHPAGEVKTLAQHLSMLNEDRALLQRLRNSSLNSVKEITWTAAGAKLLQIYRDLLARRR